MYTGCGNALASSFMADPDKKPENVHDAALEGLLEQARHAARQSYAPYSGFHVGAALRLTSGAVIAGTNVENVSYGLTICAERSALVSAVSQFGPKIRIEAVAVANLNDRSQPALRGVPPDAVGVCAARCAGHFSRGGWAAHHGLQRTAAAGIRYETEIG